jgi:O-antigen/teichoic acid export membrane protein
MTIARAPAISRLSLGSNFTWLLSGNLVYAGCQWGMIVALAKLGSSVMLGQFSLGLAIATPVMMFTNLHLRAVQATDAKRLFSFEEYLGLRSVMTMAAVIVIAAIAGLQNYGKQTTMVILALALAKGIETLSDIHYGLFQLNDRLDQTGMSMIIRGTLSVAALTAGLYLTRDVFWASIALALVWLAVLVMFDARHSYRFVSEQNRQGWIAWWRGRSRSQSLRRQFRLMRLALPLGIMTTMVSVNLNMPRYFIGARLGVHQLGIFSALAYATVTITLVSDSLGHCAMPRLSRLYARGHLSDFRSLLFQLSIVGCALGGAGLAAAKVAGVNVLTIFYSSDYAVYSHVFVVLMFAAAIHCVASMLTCGIISARYFNVQVPVFAVVIACTATGCYLWIPNSGLEGGAEALVFGATVRLVLAAAVVAYLLYDKGSRVCDIAYPSVENWHLSV